MAQNKTLDKIQTFVKEQISSTQSSLVITETAKGFKVNDIAVHQIDSAWIIKSANGSIIGHFKNRRLAVLTAALTVKKLYKFLHIVSQLDNQLTFLKHDKALFERNIDRKFKKEMFEDRYSRTIFELSQVYEQIFELEKSVHLQ
jgi:hypothetical protein